MTTESTSYKNLKDLPREEFLLPGMAHPTTWASRPPPAPSTETSTTGTSAMTTRPTGTPACAVQRHSLRCPYRHDPPGDWSHAREPGRQERSLRDLARASAPLHRDGLWPTSRGPGAEVREGQAVQGAQAVPGLCPLSHGVGVRSRQNLGICQARRRVRGLSVERGGGRGGDAYLCETHMAAGGGISAGAGTLFGTSSSRCARRR
jgi:hypothetical protein